MLAQQLLNGVVLGATYALFATGFTLVFGVLRVIDLTYGVLVSVAGLLAWWLTDSGLPLIAAIPLVVVACAALAVGLETLLLRRLRRRAAPELASLMVTLGAALALYAVLSAVAGSDMHRLSPELLPQRAVLIGPLRLTFAQILVMGAALIAVFALTFALQETRWGIAVRALAERPEAAALVGIDTAMLSRYVTAVGGGLAGLAGALIALSTNSVQPYMGEALMLRGFVVVIVGGLGSIPGALVAGLGLGLIEALTAAYATSGLKEAAAFSILVIVLWTRPAGLFGRPSLGRA